MGRDDDRIDDELRRVAQESVHSELSALEPAEIDDALVRVRSAGQHGAQRRRGRLGALAAVAAAVLLVAGVVTWWPRETPDDRLASGTTSPASDEPADHVGSTTPDSSVSAATAPSTAAPLPDEPSVVLDRHGEAIASFRLEDDRLVIDPAPTFFTRALADHLVERTDLLGPTRDVRLERLVTEGLRLHTTFDPDVQDAAEDARDRLPDNTDGVDAALVVLDTASGAVRAIVDGRELEGGVDGRIQSTTPRHTGSAIEAFVLAAALQAGAQPGDQIDGRRGCVLPGPWDASEEDGGMQPVLQINGGVAGFIGSLRDMIARSVSCGAARLSHAVGLERVVDTIYRLAGSDYLDPALPAAVRQPIEPVADLAIGVNPLSPLDMASGMQTIANDGVHHPPHFVEAIDDRNGARIHVDEAAGVRVIDTGAARDAVDVLQGVIEFGTGRRHALEGGRVAIGKTGTRQDNLDAWFVGATPQLTTAVWVGDPEGETPMVQIPEFVAAGVPRVQGGTLPADIWKSVTDAALDGTPLVGWPVPELPDRPDVRIVLPGWECLLPDPDGALDQNGATVRRPVEPGTIGTTVPPGVTDPNAPIPTIPVDSFVAECEPSEGS